MKRSWKTSLGGIVGALAILFSEAGKFLDDDPNTNPSFEMVGIAIGMLQIGIFARDENISSEQAGAKR